MFYNNKKIYFIKDPDKGNFIIYLFFLIIDGYKSRFYFKLTVRNITSIRLKGKTEAFWGSYGVTAPKEPIGYTKRFRYYIKKKKGIYL